MCTLRVCNCNRVYKVRCRNRLPRAQRENQSDRKRKEHGRVTSKQLRPQEEELCMSSRLECENLINPGEQEKLTTVGDTVKLVKLSVRLFVGRSKTARPTSDRSWRLREGLSILDSGSEIYSACIGRWRPKGKLASLGTRGQGIVQADSDLSIGSEVGACMPLWRRVTFRLDSKYKVLKQISAAH